MIENLGGDHSPPFLYVQTQVVFNRCFNLPLLDADVALRDGGAAVLKEDLALITLAEPVVFGSPNDPVTTILCVACIDRDSHMRALQTVAEALCGDGVMENLAKAQTVEELHAILHGA